MKPLPDYEALFDASPYPCLLVHVPSMTIVAANAAYLLAVGTAGSGDVVGRSILDTVPAEDRDQAQQFRTSIETAARTRLPHAIPLVRYAPPSGAPAEDSRERLWSVVHTPVMDGDADVEFVAQNSFDVTPLHAGEEPSGFGQAPLQAVLTRMLAHERAWLESLFNHAPGFIAVLRGPDHVLRLANEAYYRLVGRRDILGKSVWEALPELKGQGFEELLDQVNRTRQPVVARGRRIDLRESPEAPLVTKYVDMAYQPIVGVGGEVSAIFVQGHDVSETHRTQKELAEKVAALEAARARQALRLQLSDNLRHASSTREMFGRSSELLGHHLAVDRVLFGDYDVPNKSVTYHSNHVTGSQQALEGTFPVAGFGRKNFASLEDGSTWICEDLEKDERTSDPSVWPTFAGLRIHAAVVVPLRTNNRLIACLFVNHGAPRRWEPEEIELIQDFAERTWTAVEWLRAEQALRQANKQKDRFLAMLAHELRNPIAPIGTAAQLLVQAPLDESLVRQMGSLISRQAGHMTGLVNDLLDVARVTSGRVKIARESVDVQHVIHDAVEQLRPAIDGRGQRLELKLGPKPTHVLGDHKRLVQVLANLLSNASKYTPEGGRLVVATETTDDEVLLRVSDNGIGISEELLSTVFELFSQEERGPDRSQGGLGLGLSLVKSLVELHGGAVAAMSKGPDTGAQFTVRLPLHEAKTASKLQGEELHGLVVPEQPAPLRIMAVDDNVDAAQTLALLLEIGGHQVSIEHHPCNALARAKSERFDVYILDIGLPVMDGNELARRLRALDPSDQALLIAITGYGRDADEQAALEAGFHHFLVKPADPTRLLALLAGWAAARQGRSGAA